MKELFEYVLSNYLTEKKKLFSGNQLVYYMDEKPYKVIVEKASLDTKVYSVQSSCGMMDKWAGIPHIDILDREITNTPTKGYYIVYLFKGDMTGIYLSLNQGWTYFKKAFTRNNPKAKIKQVTNAIRYKLKSSLVDFSFDEIDLKAPTRLGKGYESGHIYGKYYSADDIPENNVLVNDLRNMLGIYRELKGILGVRPYEKIVSEIITGNNFTPLGVDEIDDEQYQNKITHQIIQNNLLISTPEIPQEPPLRSNAQPIERIIRDPQKTREALMKVDFQCEANPTHKTFVSQKTGRNYVEAHHLNPLSLQENFEYSLDVPGNIISLYPNCHRKLHYARLKDKEDILGFLYDKRKKVLERFGIEISLSKLIEWYR